MKTCEAKQFVVLIVEDDPNDAALLRDFLGESGCLRHVAIASESDEITAALRDTEFDVCVFDFRSGSKTGLELLKQLRDVGAQLPMIMITGQGGEDVAVAALHAGAADYLPKKNLTATLLNASVRHAVDLHAKERQRREAQEALVREKEFTAAVLQHSYDGIAVIDSAGQVKYYSPGMTRIFGYGPDEISDARAWAAAVLPEPGLQAAWLAGWGPEMGQAAMGERIFQYTHKSGDKRWCRLHLAFMGARKAPGARGFGEDIVVNGQDITSVKAAEARVEYVALHDPLTDLPTRRLFQDRLKQAIVQARRNQTQMALLYVDLDKFKPVNDTYGHDAGDAVLVEAATRLQMCLRASDTVARVGGDEFVVILPSVSRRPDVIPVAEKIIAALNRTYCSPHCEVEVGASVGIALYPRDGRDMDTLLNTADKAMYAAKRSGGRRYSFYEAQ